MPLASLRMKAIASAKARPIFSHSDRRFSQVSGLVATTLKASGDRCGGSPSAPLATSTAVPSTVPLRVHGSTVDMPSIALVCIAGEHVVARHRRDADALGIEPAGHRDDPQIGVHHGVDAADRKGVALEDLRALLQRRLRIEVRRGGDVLADRDFGDRLSVVLTIASRRWPFAAARVSDSPEICANSALPEITALVEPMPAITWS